MNNGNQQQKFKVALVGESGVGKSYLMQRFCGENTTQQSIIRYPYRCDLNISEIHQKDPAGMLRYNNYNLYQTCIICADMTYHRSLDNISRYLQDINQSGGANSRKVLVMTKYDLNNEQAVSEAQAQSLASQLGIPVFFTSAITGKGINELFFAVAEELYPQLKDGTPPAPIQPNQVQLHQPYQNNPHNINNAAQQAAAGNPLPGSGFLSNILSSFNRLF